MALVTFTSDFGTRDHYVASVKARILCALPAQPIVDISHQIPSCDVAHAAFVVQSVYRDFPEGSIHIVAVNTAGAAEKTHLMICHQGHYFIGPNNGLFTLLLQEDLSECYQLESPEEGETFPAAHIYAATALGILRKEPLDTLGTPTQTYRKLLSRKPQQEEDRIKGHVVHMDQTGNLITNISKLVFEKMHKGRDFSVCFEYEKIYTIVKSYSSVDFGDCAVLFNSNGWLEIAINQGHAGELLGMSRNSPVEVRFTPEEEALSTQTPAESLERKG